MERDESLEIEIEVPDYGPPELPARRSRVRPLIVAVVVVAVGMVATLLATRSEDEPVARLAANPLAAPLPTSTPPPVSSVVGIGFTMSDGVMSPTTWVLNACLADHGLAPSSTSKPSATPTEISAIRACADFLPPMKMSAEAEALMSCMRAQGVDVDLRGPMPAVIPSEVAARVSAACRPPLPSGGASDFSAFMNCLKENGIAVTAAGPPTAAALEEATRRCADKVPKPSVPTGYGDYVKCLNDNGLVVDQSKKPDYDLARRAVQACAPLAPKG